MVVTLPDTLKDLLEQELKAGSHTSADAYVSALIEADLKKKARERLEAVLLEGLDSGPATEMTAQDWDDIRAEGLSRVQAKRTT